MIRTMLITLAAFAAISAANAQQSGIERQQLLQQDGPGDFQTLVVMLQFVPGAREARHTHPGAVAGYVLDGTLTGAREGAAFIRDHIIRVTDRAFDDFAGGASDATQVLRALGLA
jgi:hypothetical protein